MNKFLI